MTTNFTAWYRIGALYDVRMTGAACWS